MKGAGATQSSGRSQGRVGVTPTGIELGINVGIGGLGISTDYGGGIVVEFGGQKIVWGREGGKIHYNLGGFEVTVEARNCVVTETRKIAGQVVGIHVYPDPGCKLPEEPKRPSSGPILQPSSNNPSGFETSKRCTGGSFELCKGAYDKNVFKSRRYPIEQALKLTDVSSESIANYNEAEEDRRADREFGVNKWYKILRSYTNSAGGAQWIWIADNNTTFFGSIGIIYGEDASCSRSYQYFSYHAKPESRSRTVFTSPGFNFKSIIVSAKPPPPCPPGKNLLPPPPPAGNQPPMPESCCESLKADIEDIKEVLACKEILEGKMTFPWKWRMPGGEGEEVILDYPNLARAIAQMIDHLGIHPPKLSIKDINNAIAGDQGLNNQFPSATQGFEALMSQVWDANADIDTLTNFLYRLSWLNVQQSVNMAVISAKVQTISDMLGGETESSESSITMPFNIGAGVVKKNNVRGQGFGKNKDKSNSKKDEINSKIDSNTEIATESLLPDFLKIRENPIVIEKFSGNADINDKIDMIILKLESLQR
jgi:hypothetical protein